VIEDKSAHAQKDESSSEAQREEHIGESSHAGSHEKNSKVLNGITYFKLGSFGGAEGDAEEDDGRAGSLGPKDNHSYLENVTEKAHQNKALSRVDDSDMSAKGSINDDAAMQLDEGEGEEEENGEGGSGLALPDLDEDSQDADAE